MAIAVKKTQEKTFLDPLSGVFIRSCRLSVTGLTTNAANTIPHGLTQQSAASIAQAGATPLRVNPLGWVSASQAYAQPPSLDGTNGGTGTGLSGFDSSNIYVMMPNGPTTAEFEVTY
ncbi:MAG TPA: hypothetical protein VGZ29_05750 [Terriglobia bacterium]|nr:hypothetical protein [Terriglobia bacterium]